MNNDPLKHLHLPNSFTKSDLLDDPFQQFDLWFQNAINAKIPEVNAMNLATTGKDGQPTIRAVLLKSYNAHGFVFYTNYKSKKAQDIQENPKVSLQFLWIPLDRQIRIEGLAQKISAQESESYFNARPRNSQIGAWTSNQSQIIPSRKYLEDQFIQNSKKFEGKPVPIPPFWGGYSITPSSYEFWQGRPNRLHDRILYTKKDEQWVKKRLAP